MTNRNLFNFNKMICRFLGHDLRVSKNITNYIKEYRCCRCGEEMTDSANGLLEKLTPRFRETNAFLAKIHQRRCARKMLKAS